MKLDKNWILTALSVVVISLIAILLEEGENETGGGQEQRRPG